MKQQPVPCTTSIRTSRVGNIDTDRLGRRRFHLIWSVLPRLMRDDGTTSRHDWGNRIGELCLIEDELQRRGETIQRRTFPKSKRGRHVGDVVVSPDVPKHYRDSGIYS